MFFNEFNIGKIVSQKKILSSLRKIQQNGFCKQKQHCLVYALPQTHPLDTQLVCQFSIAFGGDSLQILPFGIDVRDDANEFHTDSDRANVEGDRIDWDKNSSFFHIAHVENAGLGAHFHWEEVRTGVGGRIQGEGRNKKARMIKKTSTFCYFC